MKYVTYSVNDTGLSQMGIYSEEDIKAKAAEGSKTAKVKFKNFLGCEWINVYGETRLAPCPMKTVTLWENSVEVNLQMFVLH